MDGAVGCVAFDGVIAPLPSSVVCGVPVSLIESPVMTPICAPVKPVLNCDLLQEMCGLPRAALEKIAVIQEKALDLAGRIHVKEELASKA